MQESKDRNALNGDVSSYLAEWNHLKKLRSSNYLF